MLHYFAAIARQVIEAISIVIIIFGVAMACYRVIKLACECYREKCQPKRDDKIRIRISFENTLMLGLQFLMAADIIGTISNPDLQGVIILSVIVLLRVILSFALSHEVAEMDKQKRENEVHEFNMKIMPEDISMNFAAAPEIDCEMQKG